MIKSFYFQHDYNAHTDVKLLFVRQKLGMEGYGIYWYILEQLAISGGRMPLKIIPVLSMQMQTPEAKVESIILHYDLFQIVDEQFFSLRLLEQIDYRLFLSEKGKQGANKRWGNRGAIKEAISDPNAKERKGKERKEDNTSRFAPPSIHEVINYMAEKIDDFTSQGEADKFINFYQSKGWVVGKAKMKDWKASVRNWIKNIPKKEPVQTTRISI